MGWRGRGGGERVIKLKVGREKCAEKREGKKEGERGGQV